MRLVILLILLNITCLDAKSQIFLNELEDIPWEKIEINKSDSLLNQLYKLNPSLTNKNDHLLELQRGYSHIVNLNNDSYPDLIIYWTALYNENMLEIYLNTGQELKKLIEVSGRITYFEKHSPISPLRIKLKDYRYSIDPFLVEYKELTFTPDNNEISTQTIDFYDVTKFPESLTMNIPFEVTQSKYRLRKTPEIDNGNMQAPHDAGNLIQEFTAGDIGIAMAEETDETGRVWWFVMMKNNINKSEGEYFFINTDETDRINNPIFGWISSRYVKRLF